MKLAPTIFKSIIKRRAIGEIHSSAKIGWNARISNLTGVSKSLKIGKSTKIDGEIIVYPGATVSIGDFCYIGANTRIWAYSSIELGDYVIIAHNVSVMDSTTHPLSFKERKSQIEGQLSGAAIDPRSYDLRPSPIRMRDGVWICTGSTVLRGTIIEREAIISAGAVVRGVVPAKSIFR